VFTNQFGNELLKDNWGKPWRGHSVDMLMKIYAGVFEGERRRANSMIEAELERDEIDKISDEIVTNHRPTR